MTELLENAETLADEIAFEDSKFDILAAKFGNFKDGFIAETAQAEVFPEFTIEQIRELLALLAERNLISCHYEGGRAIYKITK